MGRSLVVETALLGDEEWKVVSTCLGSNAPSHLRFRVLMRGWIVRRKIEGYLGLETVY